MQHFAYLLNREQNETKHGLKKDCKTNQEPRFLIMKWSVFNELEN